MFVVSPAINAFAFEEPVYSGDDTQLTCYVSRGDEPISISWTFNGQVLNSGLGVQVVNVGSKTSLLTLTNVNHRSDGEYSCTARNPAGVAVFSAELTVYGKAICKRSSKSRHEKGGISALAFSFLVGRSR